MYVYVYVGECVCACAMNVSECTGPTPITTATGRWSLFRRAAAGGTGGEDEDVDGDDMMIN